MRDSEWLMILSDIHS